MSKPLQLTVYPLWDNGFGDCYTDKDDPMRPTNVDVEVLRRRFKYAELDAEFHRTDCTYWRLEADALSSGDPMSLDTQMRLTKELNTIYRFATLPDYDAPSPAPLTTGTP